MLQKTQIKCENAYIFSGVCLLYSRKKKEEQEGVSSDPAVTCKMYICSTLLQTCVISCKREIIVSGEKSFNVCDLLHHLLWIQNASYGFVFALLFSEDTTFGV